MSSKNVAVSLFLGVLFAAALTGACSSGNPVAPTGDGTPGEQPAFTISISSNPAEVNAGSTSGATLTVTVTPTAAGASRPTGDVVVSTDVGELIQTDGSKSQTVSLPLGAAGSGSSAVATVTFLPGDDTGTANLLAEYRSVTASFQLSIVEAGSAPKASFSSQTNGLEAIFTDSSTGDPTSWSWDFGDGATSTLQNPTHTYGSTGTFTVTLTAANDAGSSTASNFVQVSSSVSAKFSVTTSGLQANFTDQSTGSPTSWTWDFGDGESSTDQNPVHTYDEAGSFTVTLQVGKDGETSSTSQVVQVTSQLQAAFGVSVDAFTATFTDQSTGSPTGWAWDFGDGGSSTDQNPVHTYDTSGGFTVRLTVTNSTDNPSTASQRITVPPTSSLPQASFKAETDGLTANFTDQSTGDPTSWSWDFGDGATSTQQNPSHEYDATGRYQVSLTVSNDSGDSTASRFVTVSRTLTANFGFTANDLAVQFQDASQGDPTGWSWDFGDGATSSRQNPTHTYDAADTYTVRLTVTDDADQTDTVSKSVTVTEASSSSAPRSGSL